MQERGYSRAASREKADLGLHQYLPFCGIHRFTLLVAGIFRLLESFLLGEQSLEVATGSLEENSKNVHQYTTKYKGRLEKPEEFGNMVIRSLPNGEVLRLKDVATIKLGAQNYVINGQIDGHPAATCMIFQTAGSNANEVVGEINDYLEIIEKELPKDVKIAHLMSTKDLGMQVSFRLVSIILYMWMYNSYKSVLCTTEKHCSTTLPTSCRCSVLWKLLGLLIFILLPVQPFHLINKKTTFNYHLFVWQNRIYTSSCFQRGLHFID